MKNNFLTNLQLDFDWQNYIEENFEYRKATNGEYRINCVSCGSRKKKLYVNIDKCFFNCFICDFKSGKYDLFDFVAKTEGIPRPQAMARLIREYTPTAPTREDIEGKLEDKECKFSTETNLKIVELPSCAQSFKEPIEGPFWEYFINRGFKPSEVINYGFKYIPDVSYKLYDKNGKERGDIGHRVLFPVYGGNHQLVSWQARVIDPNYKLGDKYLSCPDSDLAKTFWPYVKPYENHVVLQEGVIDVIATRRIGKPTSSYACFSKHVSQEQIKLLKHWNVTDVTIFFDIRDAKKQMIRVVEDLKMHFKNIYVLDYSTWPTEKDSGDCLKDPNGTALLKELLQKKINVYSDEYIQWKIKGN